MLTKMRNIFRTAQGRARSSTLAGLPKLSGAELTRSSWAKPIESYIDVPVIYKDFFYPFFVEGRTFPYTILAPSHERFIHRTSEKLICDSDCKIYVVERNGNSVKVQCYLYDGISYIEFKTALLASSLKICGVTSGGFHASSTLIFNSVTDYLFVPILKRVRGAKTEKAVENSKPEQFKHLVKISYKFMNYARHSLLEGEEVILSILQPEIRERWLTVLGKTCFRTISPTHMIILTDLELIVIREETTKRKEDKYGGIWDYIPLDKIVSLSLNEKDSNFLGLCIQLPASAYFELLFPFSAREEVNQFLDQYRRLTGGMTDRID